MLKADWAPYRLQFRQEAITSRERMMTKDTYFVKIFDPASPHFFAIGECALFKGLSAEDNDSYEENLDCFCRQFSLNNEAALPMISSIRFGFETAIADWNNGHRHIPFPSSWTDGEGGMVINGLVWMGSIDQMLEKAQEKIDEGFRCIKLKIGGQDFDKEIVMLRALRDAYPSLEIRLDANGAFTAETALVKLDSLSRFDVHSIEQPIAAHNPLAMAEICRKSPIPVALDEELIGMTPDYEKEKILDTISPAYIILKPSLCGGFEEAEQWIVRAEERGIGWWATSALESAVGLNAIASWVARLDSEMPQGLGTGQLYLNDVYSPVYRVGEYLYFHPIDIWSFPEFDWQIKG